MKRRRIKLIWGASKVIRGHWFFGLLGLYDRVDGTREGGLAISMRGVLLWSGAMAVTLYFAGALALASFWQRNPYSLLNFEDAVLYPVRRGVVAEKKGLAFIAEGTELCKAGKWTDGARLLTRGLSLTPRDSRARLMLARLHVAANRRAAAVALIRAGLTDDFPGRGYLEGVFEIAEQSEDYELVVTTADRYLRMLEGPAELRDRRWLSGRKFAALITSKRAAEALAFAESEEPSDIANEHRLLALVESGKAAEALAFLDQWSVRPGADRAQLLRLKVRVLREAGSLELMADTLAAMRALTVGDPRTAAYGIVQWALAGQTERASAAFDDFIFRFGGTAANLTLLAEPLGEIGERALLERCIGAATDRGYPVQALHVMRVQTLEGRGEWADAAAALARLRPTPNATQQAGEKVWRDWMQKLIEAARLPSDAPQQALVNFMRERPWPVKIFRRSIEALRRAGRGATALDVVAIAQGAYPASVWLVEQKTELQREAAGAATVVMLPPTAETEVMRPAVEKAFFEELDQMLRAKQWVEAERAIRGQRNRQPPVAWLAARDPELWLADVRIKHGRDERAAMLASAGIYLNGDAARARRLTELARELASAGDRAAAIALVEQVVRRTPDDAAAKRQLAEWQPAAKVEKK